MLNLSVSPALTVVLVKFVRMLVDGATLAISISRVPVFLTEISCAMSSLPLTSPSATSSDENERSALKS